MQENIFMKIIGKATIHPFLFYSSKIAGYVIWVLYVLAFFKIINIKMISLEWLEYLSYLILILGLIFTFTSLIHLGSSTRLGLPNEKTVLKITGI